MCAESDVDDLAALFRPDDFMHNVVLPDLAPDSPAVLRGSALHCLACFAPSLPTELAQHCFGLAYNSLAPDCPLPVRMVAAKAVESMSDVLDPVFLQPHVPQLLQQIAQLLASASEDSALIILEALHATINIPCPTSAHVTAQIPLVVEHVLRALGRCTGDVMIATEAVDTIVALLLKNDGEHVHAVACAYTPLCVSLMTSPEKFVSTQAESIMELLAKIVRRPKGCSRLGGGGGGGGGPGEVGVAVVVVSSRG